jgi:hypothetical protein
MAQRDIEHDPAHHGTSWSLVGACVSLVVVALAIAGLWGGLGL